MNALGVSFHSSESRFLIVLTWSSWRLGVSNFYNSCRCARPTVARVGLSFLVQARALHSADS